MLMQELNYILRQDPILSAMVTADKRKYIMDTWNCTYAEPINEDTVALFLCDANRGNLTQKQKVFAKERCAEIECSHQNAVYRVFHCNEMMRQKLVSGLAEYSRIFLPMGSVPEHRIFTPCNGL